VPAIGVMTERFVSAAELMARALGMPGYQFTVIGHPIATASPAQLETCGGERLPASPVQERLKSGKRHSSILRRLQQHVALASKRQLDHAVGEIVPGESQPLVADDSVVDAHPAGLDLATGFAIRRNEASAHQRVQ
jgi:hypothetical protein